ncbi:Fic family protein [Actinomadura macrotermitis]|uniref:Fido domain-containing protein n=1 Tax=Actinomadura macrotermitis TaxID=2585200 RepID=A0A7K0C4Y5_9ACTN|nr:Fic family protein [Actinomadura macrotermitis]MQY08511.1 hypothetical protein [Actinomadura macrotermitis]
MTADALAAWCEVRGRVPWPPDDVTAPVHAARDAVAGFFTATRGDRDPAGAARARAALRQVRADAARDLPLSFPLMAAWQRTVLGVADAPFRTTPAYAKQGRERYGIAPDTQARFERHLAESTEPGLPLPARAARVHLDVLFFHPFADGNARAAMLALAFVLAREGVRLGRALPLRTTRWADDPEGAADLARLLVALTR